MSAAGSGGQWQSVMERMHVCLCGDLVIALVACVCLCVVVKERLYALHCLRECIIWMGVLAFGQTARVVWRTHTHAYGRLSLNPIIGVRYRREAHLSGELWGLAAVNLD